MPGGDMGGGFGGGGGGGMPPMPGMGGDMSGAPTGAPGGEAPISAPPGGAATPPLASTKNSITTLSENNMANPANYGGRVLKQKTRERLDSEKQKVYKQLQHQKANQPGMTGMRDAKGRIVFTKCERQLLDQLQGYTKNGLIRYPIIPQFEVKFGSVTYPIDFAFPHLKIGIEADGETFHSSPKQIIHDKERDMKLSQLGWTILRFQDAEIEDQAERVMSTIVKTIMQKEASLKSP
jgi:very-short-patch-repair endonuclease